MPPPPLLRWVSTLVMLVTLLVFARLVVLARRQRRYAFARFPLPAGEPPLVSVLVPARDEARSIGACLRSLLDQDYPRLEVLVWDDDSTDETFAIASSLAAGDARLRVLRGNGPPSGWIGKCHALDQLARHAMGTWLLFTDADTVHLKDGVTAGLAFALHHKARLFSATGTGILGSFWERVWEPLWPAFLFWWIAPDRINHPSPEVSFAVGQWLLVEREAYQDIGGHEAVRAEMVEDCALARAAKRKGIPVRVALSSDLFSVRMYRSLGEIREGWTKNIHPALRLWGGSALAAPLSAGVLLVVTVLPFALLLASEHAPAVLAFALSLFLRLRRRSHVGYFWTLPLAGFLAALVLAASTLKAVLKRPVSWKGRSYPGGVPS